MRALAVGSVALVLAAAGAPAGAQDLGTEEQRAKGKKLYDKYCAQCHGETGDGNGPATGRVKPAPRDFTSGKYKFRTTPSGLLPADEDIARVIREGLPYTSMPGWPIFNETQIRNLVYYLKTFSEDFGDASKYGEPIAIPEPPPITEESIERGKAVYEAQGCAACHGALGRGDGRSAPTLKDDWGEHIRAADMSQRWTFRGGPTREDMFRTFSTGLNGTPMPSYADSLAVEDRWDLVNYMVSLGDGEDPGYAELLRVAFLDDEIDLSRGVELFEGAPPARFPLAGQIIEPGRDFYPATTSVDVQAVYNRSEIAFLVRWHDMRAETDGTNAPDLPVPFWDEDQPGAAAADDEGEGDDFWGEEDAGDTGSAGAASEFSDAVALQFPSRIPGGIRKPYFLYGDSGNPVDLWFVDLAMPQFVQQYVGRGSDALERSRTDAFETVSGYDRGEWHVIFKRDLRSGKNVTFSEGRFVPIAFSVWDGFNRERGNKRALSAWFYLYPEPVQQLSPVGPMIRAGILALFVELLIILWIRKRFATGTAPARSPAGGTVAEGELAR